MSKEKSSGALVGTIIIVIILIIGAIYFWQNKVKAKVAPEVTEEILQESGVALEEIDTDLENLLQELENF